MKICKFCSQSYPARLKACPNCGSLEFRTKCDCCGTLYEHTQICPTCGVPNGKRAKICPKCHGRYFTNACPNCGYTHRTLISPKLFSGLNTEKPVLQVKRSPFFVFAWFLFFPYSLILSVIKSKRLAVPAKIILLAVVFISILLYHLVK